MREYKVSKYLAWQEVKQYDLIYILHLHSKKFFCFNATGAFLIRLILGNKKYDDIIKTCLNNYDINLIDLEEHIDEFMIDLERSEIIEF